jgi:hypothetical protein
MMRKISSAGLMEMTGMMLTEMTARAFLMTISRSIQTAMMTVLTENNSNIISVLTDRFFPVGYFLPYSSN